MFQIMFLLRTKNYPWNVPHNVPSDKKNYPWNVPNDVPSSITKLSSVPNNVPSNGTKPSVKCTQQWPF